MRKGEKLMKILDWDKKGNVVRFYIGDDNLDYWYYLLS